MKKIKALLLGALAGFSWFYAISLGLAPVENFRGVLATLGCELGAMALLGLGCTLAMLASGKEDRKDGKNDL